MRSHKIQVLQVNAVPGPNKNKLHILGRRLSDGTKSWYVYQTNENYVSWTAFEQILFVVLADGSPKRLQIHEKITDVYQCEAIYLASDIERNDDYEQFQHWLLFKD